MTTRSAAPTNSGDSEDAFSSAWVPYSRPNDRRQKAAKKDLVCHFFRLPHLVHDAISNAMTAQQCGEREQFGWTATGCRMKLQPRRQEACGRNARTRPVVSRLPAGSLGILIRRPALPGSDRGVCLRGSPRSVAATGRTASLRVFFLDIDRRSTLELRSRWSARLNSCSTI